MIGKGHQGLAKLPASIEITKTARFERMAHLLEPGSRGFQLGRCTVFISPPFEGEGWHMSISHPDRYPTWDEVAKAWYELIPDAETRTGAMILPPKEEYVNLHSFCFYLHEVQS